MSSLLQLPDEVLHAIADHLLDGARKHLVNLSLVNKRLQRIVFPVLFSRIALARNIRAKLVGLMHTTSIHAHIRRLLITVDAYHHPVTEGWDMTMRMMNMDMPELNDVVLAMWPHDLPFPGLSASALTFPCLPKLRRVFLDIPFNFPDHEPLSGMQLEDITWIIHGVHNTLPLRYMVSGSAKTVKDLTIISVDIANNHALVDLTEVVPHDLTFPSLKHLTLIKVRVPNDWIGHLSQRAPALRALHIVGHGPILLDSEGISQLSELRILGLCASLMMPSDRFWERAVRVESIDLSGKTSEHHIGHGEWIHILEGLKSHGSRYLQHLDVDIASEMPSVGVFISLKDLTLLTEATPHLTYLRLTACQWVVSSSQKMFCWAGSMDETANVLSGLCELEHFVWDHILNVFDHPPAIGLPNEEDLPDSDEGSLEEIVSILSPSGRKLGITPEMEQWEIRNSSTFKDASELLVKRCRSLQLVDWILGEDMYYSGYWRWTAWRADGAFRVLSQGVNYKEIHEADDPPRPN